MKPGEHPAEGGSLRLKAKDMARAIVPHSRRAQLREAFNAITWPLYVGSRFRCNCCGGRFSRFRSWSDDSGSVRPMCPRCGSLGRQRVDWLYLTEKTDLLKAQLRVLHVAPERCFSSTLQALPNLSYLSADYDSAAAMERMDITSIRYPEASFDVVICNHVLEHVSDDLLGMREIFRVLRPGGWAMLQVPIDPNRDATFEDPTITDPKERRRIFGQYDHARIYGRDYGQRLASQGFDVSTSEFVRQLPPQTVAELQLDTDETVYIATKR